MQARWDVTLSPEALGSRIRSLCKLGPRFVGTDGERAARDLIVHALDNSGAARVREEPLLVLAYMPRSAACVVHSSGHELPVVGLQFTASGAASGPAAYLGELASEDDLGRLEDRGVVLDGAIAVFHSLYPYLFVPQLASRGAAGVIVVSEAPGEHISHYTAQMYPPAIPPTFEGRPLEIPGVTVGGVGSRHLLRELSLGGTAVSITHVADYEPVSTANVVAEIAGVSDDARVVVGAHYDTQLDSPGACDNASGVATLLGIATAAASREPPLRTLVLVAFADEEHGFAGSTAYCRDHLAELESTVGMVNLDALGWALPGRRALYADPAIRDLAFSTASARGWIPEEEVEASVFPGSDHNPFIDAGVPAAFYWRYPPGQPYYHTAGDVPELLDLAVVSETARVAASLVDRLAHDEALALGRSRPSKRWIDLRPALDSSRSRDQEGT